MHTFVSDSESTKIQVSVYHNLSGLVVLNSAGGIESANSHFVNLLFGCGSDDLKADIFVQEHESSIFRSVIQPCMWFLCDGTG